MGIDGINDLSKAFDAQKVANVQSEKNQKLSAQLHIKLPETKATKKITKQDAEHALNEPRTGKAITGLLEKSPVGLGNQQSREEIENLGYMFTITAYHHGAPVVYQSADGGTITVYNGKGTAAMGEDKRKTVYENGNYRQEMIYDEQGKLVECNIRIKDEVTGMTDPNGMLTMICNDDGKFTYIR